MAEPTADQAERMRRKAFAVAGELGLTRDERIDLTELLLLRDVDSWKGLVPEDFQRLLDAMAGFQMICQLLTQR